MDSKQTIVMNFVLLCLQAVFGSKGVVEKSPLFWMSKGECYFIPLKCFCFPGPLIRLAAHVVVCVYSYSVYYQAGTLYRVGV